jgi:hypothetical protein
VDNHVRAATKFQSADDLLKNGKPLNYIWKCFGIPASIFLLLSIFRGGGFKSGEGFLGFFVLVAFFGYIAAYIAGRVKYAKLRSKTYSIPTEIPIDVTLDEISRFLSTNLQYLSSYFYEWECSEESHAIQCKFQSGKVYAAVAFNMADSAKKFFMIGARKGEVFKYILISGSGLGGGSTNAGFGEYRCLYMAAPILSAAVEYYFKSRTSSV